MAIKYSAKQIDILFWFFFSWNFRDFTKNLEFRDESVASESAYNNNNKNII